MRKFPKGTVKTKKKVKTTKKWQESYTWLVKGRLEGVGKCIVCNSEFSIVNGGKFDVKNITSTVLQPYIYAIFFNSSGVKLLLLKQLSSFTQ
jgi:hypothetical protein